jgi:hypothetical protein
MSSIGWSVQRVRAASIAAILVITLTGTAAASQVPAASSQTHSVTCIENTGAGVGPIPPSAVTVGPVAFLGLAGVQQLTQLSTSLYADKTYMVVRHPPKSPIDVQVRTLAGSEVGLDYSSTDHSRVRDSQYQLNRSDQLEVIKSCGLPAGYSGGFILNGPACVVLTVTARHASHRARISFGDQSCPEG